MQENKTFRRLNPRLDPNFKAIFTQDTPDSRLALKSFLSAMTGGNVSDVTVKENQKASQYEGQRGILYDINCVFADGTKAQVEMQGYDKGLAYGRRSEYYASRLVSSVADVGDDWENLPKAYQISVLNLKYDEGNNDPLHHYVLADVKDRTQLEGIINVIFLELPKLPEIKEDTDIESLPSAVKWGKFIQEADNPEKQDLIDRLAKSEGGIMSADAMLRSLSDDSWRWIEQGRIEGAERDRISGLRNAERKGERNGRRKQALSSARNMLADGLTLEKVVRYTGLSVEDLRALETSKA